jgi:hypothetical protein
MADDDEPCRIDDCGVLCLDGDCCRAHHARLLAAERARDELRRQRDFFKKEADEEATACERVLAQRNALAAALRSIVNRFRYVDSQWIVDARAALQSLKADNPRGGA